MKKTIILLLVVAVAAACAREPKFTLTGTIDGAGNETVVLQKRIPGGYQVLDSATIENGTFKIEGVMITRRWLTWPSGARGAVSISL